MCTRVWADCAVSTAGLRLVKLLLVLVFATFVYPVNSFGASRMSTSCQQRH
jgi:hypothetical protein